RRPAGRGVGGAPNREPCHAELVPQNALMTARTRRKLAHDVKMIRWQREQRGSMAARVACGKVAYISKRAAKNYIRQYLGLVERVYRCPRCGNWHLTSPRKARAS